VTTIVGPIKAVARKAGLRRAGVAALRMQAERAMLATTASRRGSPTGRVLAYHSIGTEQWGVNDVSPHRFRDQIELALSAAYRFVPAAFIAGGHGSAKDLAITFDDGLLSVATAAAPILAEYEVPWTLFVVVDWADGRHSFGDGVVMGWTQVEQLAAQGVEIGSHSVSHPDFGSLPPEAARHELVESRRRIEARTGIRTTSFAIPLGQSMNWSAHAQAAAKEAGYEFVYAQSVVKRPTGTVPRTFITRGDDDRIFKAAIEGAFDGWEEWV
jgi:peptidoglycan/xylan/chitin deacetylase (PgdA/CDA1 family)